VNYNRIPVYVSLALFLSACASPKPSPTTEEVVADALPETTEIAQEFTEVPSWSDVIAQGAVKDGWIKTFGDAELEKIVDEALQNNTDLAAAGANLEAAAAFATQAGAKLIPAVSVGANSTDVERGSKDTDSSGASLNMQWELDIWGKLSAGAAAAQEAYRATEADLEAARQSLVAQIAKAWFLAAEANLQLALSDEAVKIYEETLKIVETRVEAGAGSPQDVFLAKADLNAARERQRQASGALTQSVRSIEIILGRYPSAELEVASELVPTPPGIPVGLPAQLLERRPDLIAAERRVAEAFQRIEAAKAAKLPSISLTASGGSSSSALTDLVGSDSGFFAIGANLVAPLDIGGGLQAQVDIETAQQKAALANYGGIALRAFGEVESGLTNEQLLLEREAFLAAAVENNNDALNVSQTQYDAGAIDFLSVLQLQARWLNSRISLIRIKNVRLSQRVDLHLALGGDFTE
jgi:multidrug efflux system outer membrane protein